ncbi:MAG: Cell division protein FtsZ [Candidatus Dependentiae bacterium ADurb.Bin331]|nr:MAG: Cell division protein FtsZ [Candidatus Dependentiae bacterium ADurb.Bin331]
MVARALREKNILCIAVVTKPFHFEGKRRTAVAHAALETLKKEVDTLIVIPNEKLLNVVDNSVSMIDAFGMINEVLHRSVKSIADIIAKPGHINVDFADVRAIMKDRGMAIMGTGIATGADRAQNAALQAISSPLLENMNIAGAKGVLLNITGGTNLGLHEIRVAASIIYEQADQDANIILGSVIDETLTDEIHVTIIATGFTPISTIETAKTKEITPAQVQKVEIKSPSISIEQPAVTVDINDLDVPTFLRKKQQEDSI